MKKINHPLLLSVTLLTLLATTAWGAPEIRIIGQEPVYEVRGEELPGVGALDVTVGYDANGLKNPQVTQQQLSAGAILIPYFPTPGVVRVVILAPQGITGSGVLFRTAFDSLSGSAGKIISINAKMVSAASQGDVPVQTSIFVTPLPVSAVNQPAAPGGNLTDTSTSTSTSTSPLSGDTAQNSSPFAALKAALTGQAVVPPTSSGAATIAVVTPLTVSGTVGNPSSEQPPGGGVKIGRQGVARLRVGTSRLRRRRTLPSSRPKVPICLNPPPGVISRRNHFPPPANQGPIPPWETRR